MQAVADYGVFDVVDRTLRVGSDICQMFREDASGTDPTDPNYINTVCYFGGQLDPNKGDCAYPFTGARRFCPCSQIGMDMIYSFAIILTYKFIFSILVLVVA